MNGCEYNAPTRNVLLYESETIVLIHQWYISNKAISMLRTNVWRYKQ